MIDDWLGSSPTELWLVVASSAAMVAAAVATIRVLGLRSLSKMSSFDFVVTVALGSIVGAVSSSATSLSNGALAFSCLLAIKLGLASLRRRTNISKVLDNQPLLLMDGATMIDDHLDKSHVTRLDVITKLREANVTDPANVLAVVFETTGDISVLHGEGPLDPMLLEGVRCGDEAGRIVTR